MTYFLRAVLLWSGAFFLIYLALSMGVAGAWRFVSKRAESWDPSFLYRLRTVPLAVAVALVILVVIPSFLRLEPYQSEEAVGVLGIGLGCAGIVVVCFGTASVLFSLWKTQQFLAAYPPMRSSPLDKSGARIVEIASAKPMLLVTGIFRPKFLISEQAFQRLNEGEMQAAIRHELAHAGYHDNFKKLVLRFSKFPFLSGLEQTWMHAAELAADDAAATDECGAVDLASALLKLATPTCGTKMPDTSTSLMPPTEEALRARIQRLMAWQPGPVAASLPRKHLEALGILALLGLLAVVYLPLLQHVHELSELLIR